MKSKKTVSPKRQKFLKAIFGALFGIAGAAPIQARSEAPVPIVIENFEGSFDWRGGNHKHGKTDYGITLDGPTNHVLKGAFIPGTDGEMIYKTKSWNCKTYPRLSWRWRIDRMPTGAKINVDGKSDAAAQVYVGWKVQGRLYSLKYFWSESDEVGMTFRAGRWNPFGTYVGQVIRSGGGLSLWQTETRNIAEDFKKAFHKDPPDEVNGLGVLTDGDGTKTEPIGFYDDFVALP